MVKLRLIVIAGEVKDGGKVEDDGEVVDDGQ